MNLSSIFEKIIEAGIMLLLVYMPLAFGGVSPGSAALMELVVGCLMLVWLAKIAAARHAHSSRRRHSEPQAPLCEVQFYSASLLFPLGLFALLVAGQLTPLPVSLMKSLSPAAYRLYADAADLVNLPLPASLPASVCAHATRTDLYKLLAYIGLFFLTLNNIRSPHQIRRIVFVLIAVGCFESLYGFFEYFTGRHQIFGYAKQSSLTVSGTFFNKNHFAGYLEMVIPLMFSVLFARLEERGQTAGKTYIRFMDEKYMKALLVGFLLSVMIGALVLSGSRGGLLSFACGMLCLLTLAYQRRLLRKRVALVLVVLALSAAVILPAGYTMLLPRLQSLMQFESERSFQLRRNVWEDTVRIFRDYPLVGSGLGTFAHLFPQYQSFHADVTFFYAENDYLQLLAETGIIGSGLLVLTASLFFISTYRAWKRRTSRWSIMLAAGGMSAVLSLLAHSSLDFNLHIPANACVFSVVAALSYVAAHSRRRSSQ